MPPLILLAISVGVLGYRARHRDWQGLAAFVPGGRARPVVAPSSAPPPPIVVRAVRPAVSTVIASARETRLDCPRATTSGRSERPEPCRGPRRRSRATWPFGLRQAMRSSPARGQPGLGRDPDGGRGPPARTRGPRSAHADGRGPRAGAARRGGRKAAPNGPPARDRVGTRIPFRQDLKRVIETWGLKAGLPIRGLAQRHVTAILPDVGRAVERDLLRASGRIDRRGRVLICRSRPAGGGHPRRPGDRGGHAHRLAPRPPE